MSFKGIILGIKIVGKNAVSFTKRYLPQIMVGAGVCGFIGTAVASGKAALKTKDILDEKDEQMASIQNTYSSKEFNNYSDEDYKKDIKIVKTQTAVKLAKTFALPVTLGAASTALVLGGHHILGRRAAVALSAAYEAQKKLYSYDKNVVAQLGEETAAKLRNGLKIDKETVAEGMKKAEEKTEKAGMDEKQNLWMEVPFLFDSVSCGFGGGWHESAYSRWCKIKNAYQASCDRLQVNGHMSVNEVLWSEFSHSSVTDGDHGWICDPHGYGTDEMQWIIDAGYGDIPIQEFITERGYAEYAEKGDDDGTWITFKVRSGDISKLYNKINDRKRAKIYR